MKYTLLLAVICLFISGCNTNQGQLPMPSVREAPPTLVPTVVPTLVPLSEVDLSVAHLTAQNLTLQDTFSAGSWKVCDSPEIELASDIRADVLQNSSIRWRLESCDTPQGELHQLEVEQTILVMTNSRKAQRYASESADSMESFISRVFGDSEVSYIQIEDGRITIVRSGDIDSGVYISYVEIIYNEAVIEISVSGAEYLIEDDLLELANASISRLQEAR